MARAPQPETGQSLRSWYAEAEAAAQIARQLADTPFVPDSLKRWHLDERGNPAGLDYDRTVAVTTAALLTGQELGFGPMAALRSIDVIRGVPAIRAIALRALVQMHGHDMWIVESTATRAIVRGRRAGSDVVQESVWTIDRARALGVFPGKPDGPWRRQPQNMLIARASAEMARWIAADSILGVPLVAEELLDQPPDETPDGAGAPSPAPAPAPAPRQTARRKTQTQPAALSAPAPPAAPTPRPQSAPEPAPPRAQEPEPEPPAMISRSQLRLLNTLLREIGVTARADAHALVATFIDRAVGSANELTAAEAGTAITRLKEMTDAMAAERARAGQDRDWEEGDYPDADDE